MGAELISTIIAAVGIIIAAVSALLGWIFGVRNERNGQKQYRLDAISFASSYYADLRSWASESIELLTEAIERCDTKQLTGHQRDIVKSGVWTKLGDLLFFLLSDSPKERLRQRFFFLLTNPVFELNTFNHVA